MVAQDSVSRLQEQLRDFVDERDWHRFHTPQNLAMALGGEVGELLAELQWLSADEAWTLRDPGPLRQRVEDELADIAIYLLRLADVVNIDVVDAVTDKIERNRERFPADDVRGRAVRGRDMGRRG